MKRGNAFREAYNSGAANCWISFSAERVGFRRLSKLQTKKVPFKNETRMSETSG
jgi:hypothetical protein